MQRLQLWLLIWLFVSGLLHFDPTAIHGSRIFYSCTGRFPLFLKDDEQWRICSLAIFCSCHLPLVAIATVSRHLDTDDNHCYGRVLGLPA